MEKLGHENTEISWTSFNTEVQEFDRVALFTEIKARSNSIPQKRYGFVSCIIENEFYIHGGSDCMHKFLDDLWKFDFDSFEWTQIETDPLKRPKPREFHSSIVYENSLWIFGGKSNRYENDLFQFDFATNSWREIRALSGPLPSKRFGHSAVVHNNNLYICGGYDSFGFICNDLYEFSFSKLVWRKMEPIAGKIPELLHHSAVVWQGSMYVFGGHKQNSTKLYEYRFSTGVWAEIRSNGNYPCPRLGHCAVAHSGYMYVFGGADNAIAYGDFFRFHFETYTWERQVTEGLNSRYHHACFIYSNKFYVFGGLNTHFFFFNDLYEHDLPRTIEKHPDTLAFDFQRLFNNSEFFCDLTFTFSNDNRKILCHKCIL